MITAFMKNGALSQRLFSLAYGLINVHKENANDGKRSYFLLAHIQSQSRPSIQMSKANAFNIRRPTADVRRNPSACLCFLQSTMRLKARGLWILDRGRGWRLEGWRVILSTWLWPNHRHTRPRPSIQMNKANAFNIRRPTKPKPLLFTKHDAA